jgi:hypothetical protein
MDKADLLVTGMGMVNTEVVKGSIKVTESACI